MFPLCGGCAVIMTYRCNAHCKMCHRHQHQSKPEEEISLDTLNKLPNMHFMNITGGEPFLRKDIKKIVKLAHKRNSGRQNPGRHACISEYWFTYFSRRDSEDQRHHSWHSEWISACCRFTCKTESYWMQGHRHIHNNQRQQL